MRKSELKRIDTASEEIIIQYMSENGSSLSSSSSKHFAELSKLIPYSAKKIRQRWVNNLDPRLARCDPLSEIEKSFIVKWAEKNQTPNGIIRWKILLREIESAFGKLRSENQVKNFWYSEKKKEKKRSNVNKLKNSEMEQQEFLKGRKSKEPLFSKYDDDNIINLMKEWERLSDPYMKIHNEIPQYSAKQIRQRWISKLDPRLCHDPLSEAEKKFIIQWIENDQRRKSKLNQKSKIRWVDLINKIERKFGKKYSENKLKNFWNSRMKSFSKDSLPSNASRMDILCWVALNNKKNLE